MAESGASAEQEPEALRLKRLRGGGGFFTVPAAQRVSGDYDSQEPLGRKCPAPLPACR